MNFNPAEFVLRRWRFALLAVLLVVAVGLSAFRGIPRTEDPQIDSPLFHITAVLPGADPREVEELVTKPIEDAIYGLDAVREVRSQSRGGISTTTVDFRYNSSGARDEDALQREIAQLRLRLPAALTRLQVDHARPTLAAVVEVALVSDTLPMRRLEKLAQKLREQIGTIPGIREAQYWGATPSEMRVSLDFGRLAALGVTPAEVAQALRAGGGEGPIGDIQSGARAFTVQYGGAYRDIAAVRNLAVRAHDGAVLHVGDVAIVDWALGEADHITRYDGKRAVLLTARQTDGVDVAQLNTALTAAFDSFERTLPGGVRLVRPFAQADNVAARMGALRRDFLIALGLVCITLLPLGGRAALVVMVAIPLSLLIGVSVVGALGYTLNQLSIAGFVLSLGILVDDAIVVTENIVRWMRAEPDVSRAVVAGSGQIALAVVGCTLCLIFAFLPLMALPDVSGQFIRSMPVAVLATVAGSLVVSLTVIPLAASLFLRPESHPEGNRMLRGITAAIHRFYAPLLHRALDRPSKALAVLLLLTMLSIPLVRVIGTSLFPAAETPQFLIRIDAGRGASLARTDITVRYVEQHLAGDPAVAWTIGNTGRGNPQIYYNAGQHETDMEFGEVAVGLTPAAAAARDPVILRLRDQFSHYPAARISIVKFVQGPQVEAPVALRIAGSDIATLTRLAASAEAAMQRVPGLTDITNPLRQPRTDLHFAVNEPAAAGLGVGAGALRQTMQLALSGADVASFRDGDGDTFPVKVRMAMDGANRLAALDRIEVPSSAGHAVPLSAIARPVLESGPPEIDRINRLRSVTLTADVGPGVLTSRATADAEARVRSAVMLPPGYNLTLGGEAEAQSRSLGGLLPTLLLAAFGILAVLVLEFGRFRMVAVVAGIAPFGILGGVIGLWITGNSLSFTATIGLVALIGIEIKNSILLVDFSEQLRRQGMPIRAAIEAAGEARFLPILLTSVTAIGGMIPLAVDKSGLYAPVAIVLIGGLISSTLLSRIATPVMYLLLAKPDEEAA